MKNFEYKENPSEEDIAEYHRRSQELTDNFERRVFKEGDKIIISDNPCSASCGCYYQPEYNKIKLDINKVYTIEEIHYFGGGCPPVSLSILELPETKTFMNALPANWFKVVK